MAEDKFTPVWSDDTNSLNANTIVNKASNLNCVIGFVESARLAPNDNGDDLTDISSGMVFMLGTCRAALDFHVDRKAGAA